MHQVDQMGGRFAEQPPAPFRQAFRFAERKAAKPRFPTARKPFGRTADGKRFRALLPEGTGQRHAELAASPRNDDRPFEKQFHASPRTGSAATRSVPSAIRRPPDSKTHRIAAASGWGVNA